MLNQPPHSLTLLVTSPRVAPGLMSWPAWQAVTGPARLLASSHDHPVCRTVAAAGRPVTVVRETTGASLLDAAAAGDVVWLASDEESDRLPGELAAALVEGSSEVQVEVLHASYDVPGARLIDLVTVMDELRRHCPWDQQQTHRSLATYLVEETYETLDAIETGDADQLREELGDLLLQVYFHARIAEEVAPEDGGFTIDDVAGDIVDKLVRRHPHVFAGLDVAGADEVEANWETLKASEKSRSSVLDGVPMALPALHLAEKVVGRAAKVGVVPEVSTDSATGTLGDRLLAMVVDARAAGADPEQELRAAVRRLADTIRAVERSVPPR